MRLLDISLDGSNTGDIRQKGRPGAVSAEEAGRFLMEYPTAKIVVIIDTHCVKNGSFVWKGTSSTGFQACGMDEVGMTFS